MRALGGAQVALRTLADPGVEAVFGYPDGAVPPIYGGLLHQIDTYNCER